MENYIEYLERMIENCKEDKDLQREHWAFCQALKKYRELTEQLRQSNVVGQRGQLVICKKCGSSQMYQYTKIKDKCEDCGNIQDY